MAFTVEPAVSMSLTVNDTAEALGFYARTFVAQKLFRMPMPSFKADANPLRLQESI